MQHACSNKHKNSGICIHNYDNEEEVIMCGGLAEPGMWCSGESSARGWACWQGLDAESILLYLTEWGTHFVKKAIKTSADSLGKYSCCATCFRARIGPSISLTGTNFLSSDYIKEQEEKELLEKSFVALHFAMCSPSTDQYELVFH